jgi:hypothetical protein
MFEAFSGGYYLGRLYVEPHDTDRVVMHEGEHREVAERVYDDGDEDLVMKIGTAHLPVGPGEGVPSRTVGVPAGLADEIGLDRLPALEEVLLAKPSIAARIRTLYDRAGRLSRT